MIAAVVLAAGAASRYGRPKQWELLPSVLDAVSRCAFDDVVVVEGAHPLDAGTGRVVRAESWADGPGASLRTGLAALGDDVGHAVVILADGPDLDPRAVARVIEHRDDAEVVAASYDGTRNHPVVLARSAWERIPDEGARALEPLLVDCSDLTPPGDVDVPREIV